MNYILTKETLLLAKKNMSLAKENMSLAKIGYNLLDFVYNDDFANSLVQLISSRDFAKLILISKEFKKYDILLIIQKDYERLYYEFIVERALVYPLIFSHHFVGSNANELSKLLSELTMTNLQSNVTLSHIPDKDFNFSPHDKEIRRILYQLFSLYLYKPKKIVNSDGSISFDDVGSITSIDKSMIDTNGKWADTYKNGVYSKKYELNIIYKENGDIDDDASVLRYNEDYEIDPLGLYEQSGCYIDPEFYHIYINPLFLLLHKFGIKLKNKLIIDRIIISPFEKQTSICNLHGDITDIIYTHHTNCFYGNIETNLEIDDDLQELDLLYTFAALVPIGGILNGDVEYDDFTYYILGNEHDKYVDILTTGSGTPGPHETDAHILVYSIIRNRPDLLVNHYKNTLQPHNNTIRYDTTKLFEYLPVQDWPILYWPNA